MIPTEVRNVGQKRQKLPKEDIFCAISCFFTSIVLTDQMSNSGSGGSNEFCNMKRDLLSMGFEEEAVILAVRHTETIGAQLIQVEKIISICYIVM